LVVSFILATGAFLYLNPVTRMKINEAFDPNSVIQLDSDQSMERTWGGKALRVAIWKCAWDVVKLNPVWGVGTGDVQDNLQESYRINKFDFAYLYNSYNAHNQFLETMLALGVIGLLLLLCSFILPLQWAFKNQNGLYLIFIIFIAANCLTESLFERQKGIVFYAFFNALFLNYSNRK
jgi:O-antigen ligase